MAMKLESRGEQVKCLQYGLHIMCFSPKAFTGYFGTATEACVKKYQEAYGLAVDGSVGNITWNSICGEIRPLQQALAAKGYYTYYVNGIPGEKTYNAIINFQKDNGLSADGMVGSATRAKLMRSESTEVGDAEFPLKQGDRGDKVNYLQYGLHILCCHPNGIDGSFGPGTTAAVKTFQTKYGLTADGIVGTGTWNKMKSLIMEIQKALLSKGFNIGVADGVAGPGTYEGVLNFQKANGLVMDGQVGPATREKLLGSSSAGGTDAFPLKSGSKGSYVFFVQYGLWILCINPNGIDGSFGPGTVSAVKRFQSSYGLTADGVVDTITWEKLRSCIRPIQQALVNHGYDTGGVNGIAGEKTYNSLIAFQSANGLTADGMAGNATKQKLGVASSGGGSGTTTAVLRLGSNGSLVRYLQQILKAMGYTITINGTFDDITLNAVKSFQSANGLAVDGVSGPGTWRKIFEKYKVNAAGTGVEKLVNVAKHELAWAFREDNGNNITPYGQWYGINPGAWCAMFVSWCAKQAGILDTTVPKYAYCPSGVELYRAKGKFFSRSGGYVPKVGDTIFFWSTDLGRVGHTGIVIETTATTVTTIEGNTNDGVGKHTYNKTNTYIHGYGCNSTVGQPDPPAELEEKVAIMKKMVLILSACHINSSYLPTSKQISITDFKNGKVSLELNKVCECMIAPHIKLKTILSSTTDIFDNDTAVAGNIVLGDDKSPTGSVSISNKFHSIDFNINPDIEKVTEIFDGLTYYLEIGNMKIAFGSGNKTEVIAIVKTSAYTTDYTETEFGFLISLEYIPDDPSLPEPIRAEIDAFIAKHKDDALLILLAVISFFGLIIFKPELGEGLLEPLKALFATLF